MKRRLLTVFGLAIGLLLLLIGIIPAYARYLGAASGITKTITLTGSGFSPVSLTIYSGTTVIWKNETTTTYTLLEGTAPVSTEKQVYLPIILVENTVAPPLPPPPLVSLSSLNSGQAIQATATFSGTLPPGGEFSHQFTAIGTTDFYLAEAPEISGTVTVDEALLIAWILNTTETAAFIKDGSTGTISLLVNVQSAQQVTLTGDPYALVGRTGIPNYTHTMTLTDVQTLNSRPNAATDFAGALTETTATVGQVVQFGENIGYDNDKCPSGAGQGYWPPGPDCPDDLSDEDVYFPLAQQISSADCETGLGTIGLWVNGAAIFNWSDGFYYDGAGGSAAPNGVWKNLAPALEVYDVDICWGHTAGDTYHHHNYSTCLGEQLNDTGTDHSPIYGFAADGYPVYGPWADNGVLAQSCWKKRDYSAGSPTGCGENNKRTCLLANQLDITTPPVTTTLPITGFGPDITATITTQSNNPISATSGIYYQDYYYDSTCTAQDTEYLDEHNGHTHNGLGYHYHVTAVQDGDSLTGVFPYMIGPTFYGELQDNAVTTCSGP